MIIASLRTHGAHLGVEKQTHNLVTASQSKCV